MNEPDSQNAAPPVPGPLRSAIAIGLIAGVIEAALMVFSSLVLHRYVRRDPAIVWIAPIGVALVCVVATLPLFPWARRPTATKARAAVIGVAALIGAFELTLLFAGLHPVARAIFSAGVGVQSARIAASRPLIARGIVRIGGLAAAAITVLACAGLYGAIAVHERRVAGRVGIAQDGAPNILLLILDTVRASEMSLFGASRPTTPHLAEFAKQGVVFDRAYSPSPWTLQSHATFFTGRHAHELNAEWLTPLEPGVPVLAEILAARGYATAGFTGNLSYTSRESGLARGFAHYRDFPLAPSIVLTHTRIGGLLTDVISEWKGMPIPKAQYRAPAITRDFLNWIPTSRGRPWFAFINVFDAHNPYLPPPELAAKFATPGAGPRNPFLDIETPTSIPKAVGERDAYAAGLAAMDAHVGVLFDSLRAKGALDNTIVLIVSDHGEHFGEHGLLGHGNSLYAPNLHIPLIVVAPRRAPSGVRITEAVSSRDVAATILELAGAANALPGRSLSRFWQQTVTAPDTILFSVRKATWYPDWVPSEQGDMAGVIIGRYQLIRDHAGGEEVFDLVADPDGLKPLDRAAVPGLGALRAAIPTRAIRP